MNSARLHLSKFAFWSICVVAFCWAAGTLIFEISSGIPNTREEWAHRVMGWFVQFVLIRTFQKGVRRYYAAVT